MLNPDSIQRPHSPKMEGLFLNDNLNYEFTYNLKSSSQYEESSDTNSDIGTEVNGAKTHL